MPLTNHEGNNNSNNTSRFATVTMMLAQRIVQPDWSVDERRLLIVAANKNGGGSSSMNVWQTLEVISGLNIRRQYHYEGYNDTHNTVRTLTPSWRRDSFAEKTAQANGQPEDGTTTRNRSSEPASSYLYDDLNDVMNAAPKKSTTMVKAKTKKPVTPKKAINVSATINSGARVAAAARLFRGFNAVANVQKEAEQQKEEVEEKASNPPMKMSAIMHKRRQRRRMKKAKEMELDDEFSLPATAFTDLVQCNFNLPRISACLERLMGTNVVRLTDRKYMNELRTRIDESYKLQLLKRIRERELREVERERILIIEGKTDKIPEELSDDPIFVVNKNANVEIQKKRAKMKTIRERNSDRLRVQGVKWERERLHDVETEQSHAKEIEQKRKERKAMEEKFQKEDNQRGMDLLRIYNEDWRACEQKLKEFLEHERARMKERSWRVPTAFTSDKRDMLNITRARKKFRETELRIRNQLEEESRAGKSGKEVSKDDAVSTIPPAGASGVENSYLELKMSDAYAIGEADLNARPNSSRVWSISSDLSGEEEETYEPGSSISVAKRAHTAQLEKDTAVEEEKGLLITKEQYQNMRYEEIKIQELRKAQTMRDLYRLAEEIIIGEELEENPDEVGEEEDVPPPPPPKKLLEGEEIEDVDDE